MGAIKEKVINEIIRIEGGYVNNKKDSGGATCWGITETVARANGYVGDMRNLPTAFAFSIYAKRYWYPLRLDDVELLSPLIAEELADTGVNCGISRAGEFFQRVLNVMNKEGTLYPDLVVDGKPGDKTIQAFKKFILYRGADGEVVFNRALNSLQGAFYINLCEKRQKDEEFVYGWFKNRVK